MIQITIAICTFNRYALLRQAIESAKAQAFPKANYKIIVIDNSADHEYAEHIKCEFHKPPYFEYIIEREVGLSNARNLAARICNTEYIAYLDDDAKASPQWLEKMIEAFERFGPETSIVGGRVKPIWQAPRPLWLCDSLLEYLSVVDRGDRLRLAYDDEWFGGGNMAYRTKDIIDAGGFDVNLGRKGSDSILLSNEEMHLLDRLRKSGKRVAYAPQAVIDHLVDSERLKQRWFRRRVAWQAVSDYISKPELAKWIAFKGSNDIFDYFSRLPPSKRNLQGLFYDTDSPDLFSLQLQVIRILTAELLFGFEHLED